MTLKSDLQRPSWMFDIQLGSPVPALPYDLDHVM